MNIEQRNRLKKACGELLDSLGLEPGTLSGNNVVFHFWAGVLETMRLKDQPDDAVVMICLSAGRFEDLVEMPK